LFNKGLYDGDIFIFFNVCLSLLKEENGQAAVEDADLVCFSL
jgi:hypothetical protein